MKPPHFTSLIFLGAMLAGCGSMPSTPDILVENVKGGKIFSRNDSLDVKKPLAQVSRALAEKSQECLNKRVTKTTREDVLLRRVVYALTPKMYQGKDRTRLTVQVRTVEGATEVGDIPPDGWYMLVVDARPVNSGTTRVDSYFQYSGFSPAFDAIRPWVTGTNMGCPDLTQ